MQNIYKKIKQLHISKNKAIKNNYFLFERKKQLTMRVTMTKAISLKISEKLEFLAKR